VLKAWEGCNLARGIWTGTGAYGQGVVYRGNTVKVEAVSDKVDFADVNAAIACVDVNGDNVDVNAPLPAPVIFEDNTFIGNTNLIMLGCGYGIGGSTRFYRTTLEKIDSIDDYFEPVRLGFWNWNTRDNYLIDAIPGEGVDLDQAPVFFGDNNGYMEIYYGNTKKLLVTTCQGNALRNTDITISTTGLSPIVTKTDSAGYVTFQMLTVRHLKANGVISRTDYSPYTFTVAGYSDLAIATDTLKSMNNIVYDDPGCHNSGIEIAKKNRIAIYPNPVKDELIIENGQLTIDNVEIYNVTGHLVKTWHTTSLQQNGNTTINVSDLPQGVYIVKAGDWQGKFVKK
jgi:hypothetical protein